MELMSERVINRANRHKKFKYENGGRYRSIPPPNHPAHPSSPFPADQSRPEQRRCRGKDRHDGCSIALRVRGEHAEKEYSSSDAKENLEPIFSGAFGRLIISNASREPKSHGRTLEPDVV